MPTVSKAVALGVCLLAAAPAAADPAAEQMFRDAKQLVKDGHIDLACAKFEASQAIEPKIGTLLNLADCRERQGKLATAWDLFLQAKALASRQDTDGVRAAEAAKRAQAIAPRRAFLTIAVPAERRVTGLRIMRDGAELPAALWDAPIPIDPGTYVIVASAPGHQPQTTTVAVAREAKATATIAALVASPADAVEPPIAERAGPAEQPVAAASWSPRASVGLGPLLGVSSDGDLIVGGRAVVGITVPDAQVRGAFSLKYTKFSNDPGDPQNYTTIYAYGLAVDYVRTLGRRVAAGGGIGFGIDYVTPSYQGYSTNEGWFALRASPLILRLGEPRLELGAHVELVVPANVAIATIGLDWFIW